MSLFVTTALPFLAHSHASAVAFLTCRHHNFHASIIPEFLSDEERVQSFCEARQQNQLEVDNETQYEKLYNLFVQTPLMQFSPSLVICQEHCAESILKPLLETKYFTRTLQRCSVGDDIALTNDLLQALSKVQSLTKLEIGSTEVNNEHLEIIVNYFPSLETLSIESANGLDSTTAISISSPLPPGTESLRSLALEGTDTLFATQFILHLPNLRKLKLSSQYASQELDLLPFSCSLPFLTDLSLTQFNLESTESLINLGHLSTLDFIMCCIPDLSFLTQENSLPELRTLRIDDCGEHLTSSEFAALSHAPNLYLLAVHSNEFDNDCLQHLANMVHLRKLDLSYTSIVGDSHGSLKTLMQNLFQLEELDFTLCNIGNHDAIAGALYSSDSRLRVVNLRNCKLVDDDLNGIGALKNTLEVLDLGSNAELTNEGLMHIKDLAKLKIFNLSSCVGVDDLSPLKGCLNLEELDVSFNDALVDDSFKVFSEEPNSFPNLRILNLLSCKKLTEKVFEHLSKNNHLVYQLKELEVRGMSSTLLSSATARNHLCQLQGLRRLKGILNPGASASDRKNLKGELMRCLRNLEEAY